MQAVLSNPGDRPFGGLRPWERSPEDRTHFVIRTFQDEFLRLDYRGSGVDLPSEEKHKDSQQDRDNTRSPYAHFALEAMNANE